MAYTWKNRKGVVYTLCKVETKRGPRYIFAREPKGTPLTDPPAGYEVKESVHGVVSLRKERPSRLNPLEGELVRASLRSREDLRGYRVDADGDRITVFEPSLDPSPLERLGVPSEFLEDALARSPLSPVLRFTLVDPEKRVFAAERWCYLGGIDTWIHIHRAGRLSELTGALVPHLRRESFYDLL